MTKYAPKTQNIIAFIDTEVSPTADRILDYGAILSDGRSLHTRSFSKFAAFLQDSCYLCGHNLLAHDIPYLKKGTPTVCPGAAAYGHRCGPAIFRSAKRPDH